MSEQPIQRYEVASEYGLPACIPVPSGRYVLYSDHVSALAAERDKAITDAIKAVQVDPDYYISKAELIARLEGLR